MPRSRRAAPAVLAAAAVALGAYLLPAALPGGTADGLLGPHARDPAARARFDADFHPGWPLPARFAAWIAGLLRGDFGRSALDGSDAGRALLRALPVTLLLLAGALLAAGAARAAAARRGRSGGTAPVGSVAVGVLVVAVLAGERLAGIRGAGDVLGGAVQRRDLVPVWGAVTLVLLGAAALAWGLGARAAPPVPAPPLARAALGPPGRGRVLAAAWAFGFAAVAALAPRLPLTAPGRVAPAEAGAGVGAAHWLGADALGRDVLSRALDAARGTLALAAAGVVLAAAVAMVLGAAAAGHDAPPTVRGQAGRLLAAVPAPCVALALAAFGGRTPGRSAAWLAVACAPPLAGAARARLGAIVGGGPPGPWASLLAPLGRAAAVALVTEPLLGALGLATESGRTVGTELGAAAAGGAWAVALTGAGLVAVTAAAVVHATRGPGGEGATAGRAAAGNMAP